MIRTILAKNNYCTHIWNETSQILFLKFKLKQCITWLLMIVPERKAAYIIMQRIQFLFRQILLKFNITWINDFKYANNDNFISSYSPFPPLCGLSQSPYNHGAFSCSSAWLPLSCDRWSKILWLILIHQPKVSLPLLTKEWKCSLAYVPWWDLVIHGSKSYCWWMTLYMQSETQTRYDLSPPLALPPPALFRLLRTVYHKQQSSLNN